MSRSILFLFLSLIAASHSAKFPNNWKKCPKTNNEECLKEAIKSAIVDMKDGKKELGAIPLDPLHFNQMELSQGGKSPVNINLTFSDLDLIGSSRANVKSAKVDWDTCSFSFDVDILDEPVSFKGNYIISGKVLVLPIKGEGKSNITLENFSVLMTLDGSVAEKNGKKYCNIDKSGFVIQSSRVHFHFTNLFDGQQELGDNMNKFLNENWKEIMNEMNQTISSGLGSGVQQVAQNIFHKIPLKELYTE